MLQQIFHRPLLYLIQGMLLCFFFGCTSGKEEKINSLQAYVIRKNDFINTITASGILETSRSVSVVCPVQGYDILINWLAEEGTIVHRGDTLCKLECADLETDYNEALKNADLARSDFEKAKAQQELEISILQSQIKTNDASTQIALLDSSKLVFLSPANRRIAELTIEKALIEKKKLVRHLEFTNKINKSALRALQTKIQIQERRMQAANDKLGKLIIVSDTSGIVQYERNVQTDKKLKPGDIIWGRMSILRLVDLSEFQVRLLVNENQYQNIQKDQEAEMTLDAFQNVRFHGKIILKKPSGKPVKENSNVRMFEILASVDSLPSSLQPGVSVTCKIYLNKLKDTISIPVMSVFEKDSLKIVYLRKKGKIEQKTITTSLLSDKYIVVTSGLKPNEQILLTEPPEYLLK